MRNISYDTSQEAFKLFMERFGEVKFALLVKSKDMETPDGTLKHKGTGFV